MTKREKQEAFAVLHREVVQCLIEIERACHVRGLKKIEKFTVIMRDPTNDDMCLVVTNDDLEEAARVAINHATMAVA